MNTLVRVAKGNIATTKLIIHVTNLNTHKARAHIHARTSSRANVNMNERGDMTTGPHHTCTRKGINTNRCYTLATCTRTYTYAHAHRDAHTIA